jgi:uncharacterized protein (TIGR02001 family)
MMHAISARAEGSTEPGGFSPPYRAKVAQYGGFDFIAQAAVASDYVAHGFSQTAGGISLQGKGEVWNGPFFGGVRAANTQFDADFRQNARRLRRPGKADLELDIYAGAAPSFKGVDFLLMAMYADYPNASDSGAHFNFAEYRTGIKGHPSDYLETGFNIYYSPNYFADAGQNWILEGTLAYTLPKVASVTPVLSSAAGYQIGDHDRNGFNYWYWNTGVTLTYADRYKFDLRYHDTAMVPFSCSDQCGTRFVAGVKVAF